MGDPVEVVTTERGRRCSDLLAGDNTDYGLTDTDFKEENNSKCTDVSDLQFFDIDPEDRPDNMVKKTLSQPRMTDGRELRVHGHSSKMMSPVKYVRLRPGN